MPAIDSTSAPGKLAADAVPSDKRPAPRAERSQRDKSASDIISTARARTVVRGNGGSFRSSLLVAASSAVLLWASFPPLNWSPLAWVALVPLLALVRPAQPTHRLLLSCYLGGLTFFLPALQWMRLGDPAMYLAWWALAAYLAATFPVMVVLCRVAVLRCRIPLVVCAPVVWVGLEFLRAHLFTGFAWYFVGHTQYRWLELIQISDLVGAYGVSLVVVTANAAITSLLPISWLGRWGLLSQPVFLSLPTEGQADERFEVAVTPSRRWPVAIAIGLVIVTLGYGFVRRHHAQFIAGPRVALIQGNFVASLRIPSEDYGQQYLTHLRLTALALREQPDVIVWPEAMFRWPLTQAPEGLTNDELQRLAPKAPPQFWRDTAVRETLIGESRKTGAAMIYGLECLDLTTDGRILRTNSAVLSRPDLGLTTRYDKNHLVPFGEYIPFQKSLPWLQKLTPYPSDFGLEAGTQAAVFEYRDWRMVPVICFEDTVPQVVRRLLRAGRHPETGKPADLLVNLSNDGWFHGSSGLDQHLITAAFRAVEFRTPLVRAVNTGISAIVDGDGAIRPPETFIDGDQKGRDSAVDPATGRWHRQLNAALVSTVPLDRRDSFYLWAGDWFAGLCLLLTVGLLATALIRPSSRLSLSEPPAV